MARPHPIIVIGTIFVISLLSSTGAYAQDDIDPISKKFAAGIVEILTYSSEGTILSRGSGFFIGKDGRIITCRHLLFRSNSYNLSGSIEAVAITSDGKYYPIGKVVADDKEGDLVMLSVIIPSRRITPLTIKPSLPDVGEKVLTFGGPKQPGQALQERIVTAIHYVPDLGVVVHVDPPLSPESSGTPVVNGKGEVVGIVSSHPAGGQNRSFVIPGERIKRLSSDMEQPFAEWSDRAYFEKIVEEDKLFLVGRDLYSKGDFKKAIPYFERAVKNDPRLLIAYYLLGNCKFKLGRYQDSLAILKKSLEIDQDYADAHNLLGKIYGKLGRYQDQVTSYQKEIRIRPGNGDTYHSLGNAYFHLGKYEEALEAYEVAAGIVPDKESLYSDLGNAYAKLGRSYDVIDANVKVIAINPDNWEAHYRLGMAYLNLNMIWNSTEALNHAVRLNPKFADASYHLGIAYYRLDRYQDAIEALNDVIEIDPDREDAHFHIGLAYGKSRQYQEEIRALKIATTLNPDFAEAHFHLGWTYLLIQDNKGAFDEYRALKPLNRKMAKELYDLMHEYRK